MARRLKLICVLAHPDDESLGTGGILAKYAAERVETHVLCATRGQRGRFGTAITPPSPEEVGKAREGELREACRVLGVSGVTVLDYMDGELDKADRTKAIGDIIAVLRRVKPDVVVTFGPDGAYGHPDHIAISQFTSAAIVAAADPNFTMPEAETDSSEPHRVPKLYYMAWTNGVWEAYQTAFRRLTITVDGVARQATPWPDWSITTRIDTTAHWQRVWQAVLCHKTQLTIYDKLMKLPEEYHRSLWGTQEYYRVFSLVNGSRRLETDLFEGLR